MRMIVLLVALALLVLVPVAVVYLGRRGVADFQRLIAERGFRLAATCPIKDPLGPDMRMVECYQGQIQDGVPVTLFYVERHSTSAGKLAIWTYMGLYFPPEVELSDAWLRHWQDRVAENKGKALPLDTHAERRPGGGVVIARYGGRSRAYLEPFLTDVKRSLASHR